MMNLIYCKDTNINEKKCTFDYDRAAKEIKVVCEDVGKSYKINLDTFNISEQ